MSSALVCAQPATSLPGLLAPGEKSALIRDHLSAVPRLIRVTPAAHLEVRPAPATVSSGLAELDALTGGFPRGCLTEIFGPASSGRTSVLTAALAAATRRQEACALVDVSDALDPQSAVASGIEFKNLLWVRCAAECRQSEGKRNRTGFSQGCWKAEMAGLEQALKVTDLILQSGGFGLVAIDMGDIPLPAARRIPLTSWFRFRRAVENTPTVLLVLGQGACAGTCTSLLLQLRGELSALSCQQSEDDPHNGSRTVAIHNFPHSQNSWVLQQGRALLVAEESRLVSGRFIDADSRPLAMAPSGGAGQVERVGVPAHAQLLDGIAITAELLRSRLERMPVQSVRTRCETKTAWNNRQS